MDSPMFVYCTVSVYSKHNLDHPILASSNRLQFVNIYWLTRKWNLDTQYYSVWIPEKEKHLMKRQKKRHHMPKFLDIKATVCCSKISWGINKTELLLLTHNLWWVVKRNFITELYPGQVLSSISDMFTIFNTKLVL